MCLCKPEATAVLYCYNPRCRPLPTAAAAVSPFPVGPLPVAVASANLAGTIFCTRCSPSPCHCTPSGIAFEAIFAGIRPDAWTRQGPPPVRPSVRVRQRPIELEAIQVGEVRKAVNALTWMETLPLWVVSAIGTRIIGVLWHKTVFDGREVDAEDWIVREPDGSLSLVTPAAFEQAFERL